MSSILSPTVAELKRNIDLFEAKFELTNWFYEKCVEEFKKVNLCKTDVKDIERIVMPFLSNWGMMGRVLNHPKRKGVWEKKLVKIINDKCEVLKELRNKELSDDKVNLDRLKGEIEGICEMIDKLIAPTSASKVLHLMCPKFFPLWDSAIRDKIGLGRRAAGYYRFMIKIREFLKKYKRTLSQLQQKYHKGLVKLCDEHFLKEIRQFC